jgi:hypothetical protein
MEMSNIDAITATTTTTRTTFPPHAQPLSQRAQASASQALRLHLPPSTEFILCRFAALLHEPTTLKARE